MINPILTRGESGSMVKELTVSSMARSAAPAIMQRSAVGEAAPNLKEDIIGFQSRYTRGRAFRHPAFFLVVSSTRVQVRIPAFFSIEGNAPEAVRMNMDDSPCHCIVGSRLLLFSPSSFVCGRFPEDAVKKHGGNMALLFIRYFYALQEPVGKEQLLIRKALV
ncbi:MAG: hypothetical protein K5657_08735 [Desulfovibrio sp.]|nr:hypothetical protein [Desulfovibrio sp.]